MKRLISLCLSAVMILSLMTISFTPVCAETVTDSESETTTDESEVSWEVIDYVLYIRGNGEMPSDLPWSSTFFKKVVIEDGITNICDYAFNGNKNILEVSIGNKVTTIGEYAFNACTQITEITLPESVVTIGSAAFSSCSALTSLYIGGSVTNIGSNAFASCGSLTSIVVNSYNPAFDSRNDCNAIIETATNTLVRGCNTTVIPDTVTSLGASSFNNCTFNDITIPSSITTIDAFAFYYCTNLTDVVIPDSVTTINDHAFHNCYKLQTIDFSDSLVTLGNCALSSCTSLTSVELPPTLKSIGNTAFSNCVELTDIRLSASITHIGEDTFSHCNNLLSISVDEDNTVYDSRENCNAIIETATNSLLKGCINTKIPNTVTSISTNAFQYSNLTTLVIPDSVVEIGEFAFQGCHTLAAVSIPESITALSDYLFRDCTSLVKVIIPESVTEISPCTFAECNDSFVIHCISNSAAHTFAAENEIEYVLMDEIAATPEEVGPFKVEGVKITNITENTYTVEWEPLEEAVKYWVYVDGIIFVSTTDTSVTIKGKAGNEYCVQVVAKLNDDRITKLTRATTVIAQVLTGDTVNLNGVKAVSLSWNEIEGVSKYWVYSYNEATDSYSVIASTKTNDVSLTKLSHTNSYKLKVRTFIDGVLTDISGIRVTYDSVCTSKVIDSDSSSLTVTWTPYENAEKYWVFVSSTTDDIKNTDEWTVYSTTENNLKTYIAMEENTTYNIVVRVKYTLEDGTSKTFDYKTITGTTK